MIFGVMRCCTRRAHQALDEKHALKESARLELECLAISKKEEARRLKAGHEATKVMDGRHARFVDFVTHSIMFWKQSRCSTRSGQHERIRFFEAFHMSGCDACCFHMTGVIN